MEESIDIPSSGTTGSNSLHQQHQQQQQKQHRIRKEDLDLEEAETANITSLENRQSVNWTGVLPQKQEHRLLSSSLKSDEAVPKPINRHRRHATAGNVVVVVEANNSTREHVKKTNSSSFHFKDLARRARLMQQVSVRRLRTRTGSSGNVDAQALLQTIQQEQPPSTSSSSPNNRSSVSSAEIALLSSNRRRYDQHRNTLYESLGLLNEPSTNEEEEEVNEEYYDDDNDNDNDGGGVETENVIDYLYSDENNQKMNKNGHRQQQLLPLNNQPSVYGSVANMRTTLRKRKSRKQNGILSLLHICNCQSVINFFCNTVLYSPFLLIAMPMFLLSWFMYYNLNNPTFPLFHEVFGTEVTYSWWLNFVGRQILLFDVSRMTQWIVVDCCILGSTRFRYYYFGSNHTNRVAILGPYITMISIQSRGFPCILVLWGIYDMFLLRGTNEFQNHWFYWTTWKIYVDGTSGKAILSSPMYLRLLLAMMFIGIATTIKRVIVDIVFGKRLLVEFKPRMEMLLADIVLMNEISILAEHIEAVVANDVEVTIPPPVNSKNENNSVIARVRSTTSLSSSVMLSGTPVSQMYDTTGGIERENIAWSDVPVMKPGMIARGESTSTDLPDSNHNRKYNPNSDVMKRLGPEPTREQEEQFIDSGLFKQSSCGNLPIKDLLDQWEDPVEATKNKNEDSTIYDVLKFKRALGYMDESHPFGEAFGPAGDRDQALESAHSVYWKLIKFDNSATDESEVESSGENLSFDILSLITNDDNGQNIPEKMKALKKLFRPDARNELPMLAFIQSCDNIYKRLRFFRASVSNSSAIDDVLEGMINWIFWFILGLFVMEIMDFDSWTLMVSATSLLVSVSFALGSSVSQFVEGLLMIAVRRPYDLGDRIIIVGPESQEKPSTSESYYVEEISLLRTTIRYARTNEVSTLNNFSISKSRIINLQRSANAIVFLEMKFKTCIFENDLDIKFKSIITDYIAEHTRSWECLIFMRSDNFDPDWDSCTFHFGFRHRYSWQNAARILINRADLIRFMYQAGTKWNIFWQTPMPMTKIYDGGTIDEDDIVGPRSSRTAVWKQYLHDKFNMQQPQQQPYTQIET